MVLACPSYSERKDGTDCGPIRRTANLYGGYSEGHSSSDEDIDRAWDLQQLSMAAGLIAKTANRKSLFKTGNMNPCKRPKGGHEQHRGAEKLRKFD